MCRECSCRRLRADNYTQTTRRQLHADNYTHASNMNHYTHACVQQLHSRLRSTTTLTATTLTAQGIGSVGEGA